MNERRNESRFLCAELIRVKWQGLGDAWQSVEAVLEDISPVGICVQVEKPIALRTPAGIVMGDREYRGDVTYCVYRDYGYFVGIRLTEDSRWSAGAFVPQHLTDLTTLCATGQADI